MPKADMSLICRYGKTEGAAVKAECKTRAARTVRPAETCPEKVANCVASAAPRVTAAREHMGLQQPVRGGGVRPIVARRKIGGQIGGACAIRKLAILSARLYAWRKKNPNIYRELDRVLAPK